MQHRVTHIDRSFAFEGPGTRQHFVEQHAGGEDVSA